MADTGIFATTLQVQRKAGANASSVSNVEAYINDFISQAESSINADTEFNWSDKFSTLNVDVRGILTEAASSYAAIHIINYDPNAWSLETAAYKRDTLWTFYDRAVVILKETDKGNIFVQEA